MDAPGAYESDIPWSFERGIDFSEPLDENAAYSKLNPKDPARETVPRLVNLRQDPTQGGAVRTTFKGDPNGPVVLVKEKSNYYISVQRLVWVDGWRKTTGTGSNKKHEDEMTLVVLKLSFQTSSRDSKVGFALAELKFHSDLKGGTDPEVVAWGPFGHRETWNTSTAQARTAVKHELRTAVGWAGQAVSGSVAGERETSWDRVNFDQGNSYAVYNVEKKGQGPHGARWLLKQNRLAGQGITPEMRIAALIKRPQPGEQYRVTFRLEAYTGTRDQWRANLQKFVNLPPGDEVVWRTTPRQGSWDACYDDGKHIVEAVDLDNLGALITDPADSQTLNPVWLNPRGFFEVPQPAARTAVETDVEGDGVAVTVAAAAAGAKVHMQPQIVAAVDQPADEPGPLRGPPAPSGAANPAVTSKSGAWGGWPAGGRDQHPGPPIGEPDLLASTAAPGGVQYSVYSRLVALEARAAQAEARLAAQDQLVFQLQRALAKADLAVPVRDWA